MKKYVNFINDLRTLESERHVPHDTKVEQAGISWLFALEVELAWKLLKQTMTDLEGSDVARTLGPPRAVVKEAYRVYDFIDEDLWIDMLRARNAVVHVYDEESARALSEDALTRYLPAFQAVERGLLERYRRETLEG